MSEILPALLILAGTGFVAAAALVAASHYFSVPSDTRVEALTEILPGANCGGCGYAGCADYAAAAVRGDAPVGLCIPGGFETSNAMAELLGTAAVEGEPKHALVRCRGCEEVRFDYEGVEACNGISMLYGGRALCPYGCQGCGDCVAACRFEAIALDNGIAKVNPNLCVGCGACTEACPKNLIELIPQNQVATVCCSSHEMPQVTRSHCKNGCLGCGACVRTCPSGAIKLENFLAQIDPTLCTGCGSCAKACPTKAIALSLHPSNLK